MNQQAPTRIDYSLSSKVLPPARSNTLEGPVEPASEILGTNKTDAGTLLSSSHSIRKIIKKNTVEYFCNECNTHYARLKWVLEDHPGFEVKNFNVLNLKGEFLKQ